MTSSRPPFNSLKHLSVPEDGSFHDTVLDTEARINIDLRSYENKERPFVLTYPCAAASSYLEDSPCLPRTTQ